MSDRFLGLYRGSVVGNDDPERLGRVRVEVLEVGGDGQASWAMPCVPCLDPALNLVTIPPVGTGVWVTFEGGDPAYPVWMAATSHRVKGPGRAVDEHRLRDRKRYLTTRKLPRMNGWTRQKYV